MEDDLFPLKVSLRYGAESENSTNDKDELGAILSELAIAKASKELMKTILTEDQFEFENKVKNIDGSFTEDFIDYTTNSWKMSPEDAYHEFSPNCICEKEFDEWEAQSDAPTEPEPLFVYEFSYDF